MKIVIGCDHGAVELKEEMKKRMEAQGHTVVNMGVDDPSTAVDYPDMARMCGEKIQSGDCESGVLLCGTGLGIGISANKMKGIRCATVSDCFSARMAKEHNNANMIALGARVLGEELAWEVLQSYLNASFEGGRHERRVDKIMDLEQ